LICVPGKRESLREASSYYALLRFSAFGAFAKEDELRFWTRVSHTEHRFEHAADALFRTESTSE
jgi:hypothetical protein